MIQFESQTRTTLADLFSPYFSSYANIFRICGQMKTAQPLLVALSTLNHHDMYMQVLLTRSLGK